MEVIALAITIIGGVIGGVASLIITLGFTSVGIAAMSIAAAIQSMLVYISAGSLFALLQSAAALGVFAALQTIGFAAMIFGGILSVLQFIF